MEDYEARAVLRNRDRFYKISTYEKDLGRGWSMAAVERNGWGEFRWNLYYMGKKMDGPYSSEKACYDAYARRLGRKAP